jgi:hypothetical protein
VPEPAAEPTITLARGNRIGAGYRYAITLNNFPPNTTVPITCYDSVSTGGFYTFPLHTDGRGHASTGSYCHSPDGPDHWVRANGVESNHVAWTKASSGSTPPAIHLAQGSDAPAGYYYEITISNFPSNSDIPMTCYHSAAIGGLANFTIHTNGSGVEARQAAATPVAGRTTGARPTAWNQTM